MAEMYEHSVKAGQILIQEGDTGLAASELYVVKTGTFEVSGLGRLSLAGVPRQVWM